MSDQSQRDPDPLILAILESDLYMWLAHLFMTGDAILQDLVLDFFIYSLALNSQSSIEEDSFNMLSKDLAMSTLE